MLLFYSLQAMQWTGRLLPFTMAVVAVKPWKRRVPGGQWTSWAPTQVWHLSHFFLFPLWQKSLICLEGKSMTPHRGYTLFSSVPPSNSLVSVSDPLRAFLSWQGALQGPSTRLVRCFWNYRKTRTPSTTDANLDCAFVENALFYSNAWLWKFNRKQ